MRNLHIEIVEQVIKNRTEVLSETVTLTAYLSYDEKMSSKESLSAKNPKISINLLFSAE